MNFTVGAFRFYLARIRNASLAELAYRFREILFVSYLRLLCRTSLLDGVTPDISKVNIEGIRIPEVHIINSPVPSSMSPEVRLLRSDEEQFGHVFFSRIDTKALHSDLRSIWEHARLQGITKALFEVAGESARHNALHDVLVWIEKNPFPFGLHYLSVMECALRIPVFVYCLKLVPKMSAGAKRVILTAILRHAWLTHRRLSLYSSLGNHTIAESVGLVFAGGLFKHTAQGRAWLVRGIELLAQELPHQVLDDGGPAEQSLSYHRFVLDLYWLAVDFLERNKMFECNIWRSRLESGERFLAAFSDASGFFPAIGDCDDGHALGPGLAPHRCEQETIEAGVTTFPESGYTVVRQAGGLHLTIDHGSLGMAPLYNHGHADALSFTMSVGGVAFFVDPGTYCYNNAPDYRRYFKSTRAHNTVAIDEMDQARQLTSFIWDKPFQSGAIVEEIDGMTEVTAWTDGYARLSTPVLHRRFFCVSNGQIDLRDSFSGSGQHLFDLHFHLHPEVLVQHLGCAVMLKRKGVMVQISWGEGVPELICGQTNPILGWYSSAYGSLASATTIRVRKTGNASDITFDSSIRVINASSSACS